MAVGGRMSRAMLEKPGNGSQGGVRLQCNLGPSLPPAARVSSLGSLLSRLRGPAASSLGPKRLPQEAAGTCVHASSGLCHLSAMLWPSQSTLGKTAALARPSPLLDSCPPCCFHSIDPSLPARCKALQAPEVRCCDLQTKVVTDVK